MKRLALICVMLAMVGCAKDSSGDDTGGDQLVAGFDPPPVPAGYKRYVTPAVHQLQPGQDLILCQWVDTAAAAAIDYLDLEGYQSKTGHHVVLYSSSENEPVGTSRECTTDDMVAVGYLGAIGGEGAGNITSLPPGYIFRQDQGRTLMANVHYLNATDSVQEVQSVIDVKISPPADALKPVGMAVINNDSFQIPPNSDSYTLDEYCAWPRDTSVLMWTNHMHENGLSAYSETKRSDGTLVPLSADTAWQPEQAFNPKWTHFDVNAPLMIHAGDVTHLSCTWKNPKATTMGFPDEMCNGVGFYVESGEQIICDANPSGT